MTIHFICRGNVLRSLIAETYLKSLQLPSIETLSSGAIATETRARNQVFLDDTRALLARHGLEEFTKPEPEQLTQERLADDQLVIIMNEIVLNEAEAITTLPANVVVWNIADIGEGSRILDVTHSRTYFEEEIFNELVTKVDELVRTL